MVRAIDAQQIILQSSVMEKIQQVQQQNPDMQQKYFALRLSEQDRLLKEEVNESDESENQTLKKDRIVKRSAMERMNGTWERQAPCCGGRRINR